MIFCKKCKKEIPDGSMYCMYCGKKQEITKRKKAKRAAGTGNIYVNSKCKYHPYMAYSPSDRFGKNRTFIGSFATLRAAQEALEVYQKGNVTDLYNITLEKAYIKWSEAHFVKLTKSGEDSYKNAYKYLAPIAGCKMRELKTADYQHCIDECCKGRATCEKIRNLCSQLCKFAMQNDIIDKNYAEFLVLPKQHKKEKEIFTKEELNVLWQHSDDERVQIILILCYTGFRIGELFDIKKDNVHLNEKYIIGGKKTKAGTNRFVPIADCIKDFIKKLYDKSTTDKLINETIDHFRRKSFYAVLYELGIIKEPPVEKIYTDKKGGKHKYYEFENPRLTPHCTRHTFASLCVEAGVSPENLQKIIGHAKYETTADIYVHKTNEQLISAIALLKK